MEDLNYGSIRIKLDKGTVTRLDTAVLARLCYALDCKIEDLLEYVPPENK